jgi:membrane-associated protein
VEFNIVDLFVHLDKYLDLAIRQYGVLTYAILFFVIFAETGLVFTPFLPGDSLLFAAGTLSVISVLNVHYLFVLLALAAVTGNSSNYLVGHLIGEKIFQKYPRFLKKEYLDRTHEFYEKHGGVTVIITRFVPIIRTFAPFVAGVGSMTFTRFSVYNITGGTLWVALFIYGGYFFGNIPLVKNNFSIVTIAIILISILPAVIEYFRRK